MKSKKKSMIGIVVEVTSGSVGLIREGSDPGRELADIKKSGGHATCNIHLPRGCAEDNVTGLKFWIDSQEGDEEKNVFFFDWGQVLEVRLTDGARPIFRNRFLCPRCRMIAQHTELHCKSCGVEIDVEANKIACISE